VSGPLEPVVFVRDFLRGFLEGQIYSGSISTDEYYDHLSAINKSRKLADLSQRLFDNSPKAIRFGNYGRFRIVMLRELDGNEFPFLQGLNIRNRVERAENLVCFVGHRFLPNIERSLRFNLIHLFEPHKITLRWSGYDLRARDIFEDVVAGLRSADLCLFDNLGTLNKPNVYIEIGMAHVLGKPVLVCEYAGPRAKGQRRIPDTGSVPSDLRGLLRIQYETYEDLCRQLYFELPKFLQENKLS
jgi:hypothetical protein